MESDRLDYWVFQNDEARQRGSGFQISPITTSFATMTTSHKESEYDNYDGSASQTPYTAASGEADWHYSVSLSPTEESPSDLQSKWTEDGPGSPQDEKKLIATSGKRRAQNRAAQRAFRERKEKYARDLEHKLSDLTEKYQNLETDYNELSVAYEKLQKTVELLTTDDEGDKGGGEKLRKFLEIIYGRTGRRHDRSGGGSI